MAWFSQYYVVMCKHSDMQIKTKMASTFAAHLSIKIARNTMDTKETPK